MDIDYRDLVRVVFWPWLLVSSFLLIRRRFVDREEKEEAETTVEPPAPMVDVEALGREQREADAAARGSRPPTDSTSTPETAAGSSPSPTSGPGPEESAPTSSDRPPASTGDWSRPDAAASDEGSIFDAPAGSRSRTETSGGRKRISALVEGIELPAGLAPFVDCEKPMEARESIAFSTTGFDAGTVGAGLGEELRRLGYDLEARQQTEAMATRGSDMLYVAVHAEPATVRRGDRDAFPTATPGSVVVELWTE